MDIQTHVKLIAEDLSCGESKQNLTCPSCGGGRTGEKKFSVTRDSRGLLYNCYRAKCGLSGFVPTAAALLRPEKRQQKLREYWYPVRTVVGDDIGYFAERFQLSPDSTEQYIRTSDFDEYIFPVLNPRGLARGYVIRQPWWSGTPSCWRSGREGKPKAQTFPHAREPMQSFYIPDTANNSTLVVVEDQISAIKICQTGHKSVALLGTNADADKVREWSLFRPYEVILALDKDATSKAFKIARKWGLAFRSTRVAMLEQDLKDEDLWDIPGVLGL